MKNFFHKYKHHSKYIVLKAMYLSIVFACFLALLSGQPVSSNKLTSAKDFKDNYLGSEIKNIGWSGDLKVCAKGSLKKETLTKVLQRINYYRRMAGVFDKIELNDSYNKIAQAAALIMHSNNLLTHTPTKDLNCYSADGYNGAHTSNLSSFFYPSKIITDQMEDEGKDNDACGHRSWILYSRMGKMGFGAIGGNYALQVINSDRNNQPVPDFYSWPPRGFVPFQIVFRKWSFHTTTGKLDFSKAKVEMQVGENTYKCASHLSSGYGDRSIIWSAPHLKSNSKVIVKILNIKLNNKTTNFQYEVTIFDPTKMN